MSTKVDRPTRRDALLGDRPGSYAIARYIRMTPMKMRRVADTVRGLPVTDALDLLRFAPQAASGPIYKCVASAVANAEQTEDLVANQLYVSQIFVDEGTTMRRIRARAKGSAARILKRGSHVTVVVEPHAEAPKPAPKASAAKAAAPKAKAVPTKAEKGV